MLDCDGYSSGHGAAPMGIGVDRRPEERLMKTLLRKQLERARRDAADDKSVLRRLLPMILKQYRVFQERVESLDRQVGDLRRDLEEFSTDDRTSRDQRLRAVVDNVKDGIATVSQEGQILSVNLTAER